MTNRDATGFSLSLVEKWGLGSCSISVLLTLADVRLALIPIACFSLLFTIAPFLTRAGLFLPVISRGRSGKKAVAITFDDGPDPLSTPELLKVLQRHGAKATFFVTGERASRYPECVREILSHGHSLGNHTYSHDNLIMLKGKDMLRKEIESAQQILTGFGVQVHAFRPPAGITSPRLGPVLRDLGMCAINFSCRAFDGGNRRIERLSMKILKRLHPDAIIVLHDTRPKDERLLSYWLHEIEAILEGIKEKGFVVLPLDELIGEPVMTKKEHGRRATANAA